MGLKLSSLKSNVVAELDLIFLTTKAEERRHDIENFLKEKEISINSRKIGEEIKNKWIGVCEARFEGHIDVIDSIKEEYLPETKLQGMILMIGEQHMKEGKEYVIETYYPDKRIKYISIVGFPGDTYRAERAVGALIEGDLFNADRNTYDESTDRKENLLKLNNSIHQDPSSREIGNPEESMDVEHKGNEMKQCKVEEKKQGRQIYIKYLSSLPRKAFSDFMERYIRRIEPVWKTEEEPVDEGSLCIVVCLTFSRLLDDISAVVKITPQGCTNMLVVIQNCREGISPGPMLKHNPDDCFTDFTNILYGDGGCYECDVNSEAKGKIQSFIDTKVAL